MRLYIAEVFAAVPVVVVSWQKVNCVAPTQNENRKCLANYKLIFHKSWIAECRSLPPVMCMLRQDDERGMLLDLITCNYGSG